MLLSALALATAWAVHGWWVWTNAVDVPFHDDWSLVPPEGGLGSWLLERHNEHHLLTTRLVIAALYRTNHWDVAVHQRFNWVLFTVELLLLGLLLTRSPRGGRQPPPRADPSRWGSHSIVFAFLLFALSTLPRANHVWAVQTVVHMLVITLAAGLLGLFDRDQRPTRIVAGAAALLLLPWTLASGAVAAAAVIAIWWLWRLLGRERAGLLHVSSLAPLAALVGALLVLAAAAIRSRDPLTPPWSQEFWLFLTNLAGLGWGFSGETTTLGGFLLAVALLPAPILLFRYRLAPSAEVARWLAFAAAATTILAAMAGGRTGAGLEVAKASRYAEPAVLLLLIAAAGWNLALRPGPRRGLVLAGLWSLAALGFANDWNFAVYSDIAKHRRNGVACATAYWRGFGDGRCEPLFSRRRFDVAPGLLSHAAERRISVWRKVAEPHRPAETVESPRLPGFVDGVETGARRARVVGWARPCGEREPARLELHHRGTIVGTGAPRLPRDDVAEALGLTTPDGLGFSLSVDRTQLPALSTDGVQVWRICGTGPAERLRVTWQIAPDGTVVASDGRHLPMIDGEVTGRWTRDAASTEITGWAGDLDTGRPALDILLVAGGRVRSLGTPSLPRPAVASRLGRSLLATGFRHRLEASDAAEDRLEIVGVSDRGVASRLEQR